MHKTGNIRLMARMSLLVKPLAPHMLLAVFLGVAGFLCAIYIPYFSALLISHIAIQAADFPINWRVLCHYAGAGTSSRYFTLWGTGLQPLYCI